MAIDTIILERLHYRGISGMGATIIIVLGVIYSICVFVAPILLVKSLIRGFKIKDNK